MGNALISTGSLPAELKPRLGQAIVPRLSVRMALGKISRMRCNLVSYHTLLHIVPVRQTQVLLWCDITQEGSAQRPDGGGSDGRRDVVVCRRYVRRKRTQRYRRAPRCTSPAASACFRAACGAAHGLGPHS